MNRATRSDSWVQNPDGTPGYTCSIITGCLMGEAHPYCFAKTLANGRLRERYLKGGIFSTSLSLHERYPNCLLDPFYPRFWPDRLEKLDAFLTRSPKPVGVFLNIMGEWAGDWIPRAWQDAQFEVINKHPRHRFYLLSHQQGNLDKFSPFPPNCYVGVSVTCDADLVISCQCLQDIQARFTFFSFEPLLTAIDIDTLGEPHYYQWLNWIIIGAMTGTKSLIMEMAKKYPELTPMPYGKLWTLQPKISWVEELAGKSSIPVFLKDNLKPLLHNLFQDCVSWAGWGESTPRELRQEMPG